MTLNRRHFLGASITAAAAASTRSLAAHRQRKKSAALYQMGSRRELFVDDFLVAQTRGKVEFALHHPIPREQVISHTEPWEGTSSGYHTVLQDGDTYRLYYRGYNFDLVNNQIRPTNKEVTCYSESRDGIRWTTPHLGLYEHAGSRQNNIIWQGPGSHNFSPFIDRRPECPATARLKAFGGLK